MSVAQGLDDVEVTAEFAKLDSNSNPIPINRLDLKYTLGQADRDIEERTYTADFSSDDAGPWLYVTAIHPQLGAVILQESHQTLQLLSNTTSNRVHTPATGSPLQLRRSTRSRFSQSTQSIFRRWFDTSVYAVAAAFVTLLLSKAISPRLRLLLEAHFFNSEEAQALTIFLLAAVALTILLRVIPCHLRYLRSIHRYPPLLLSVFLGMGFYDLANWYFSETVGVKRLAGVERIALILIPATLLIFVSFYQSLIGRKSQASFSRQGARRDTRPAIEQLLADPQQLLSWISTETPICSQDEDVLGWSNIADRLARLMINGQERTFALIGPRGIGKSSIVNLVKEQLAESKLAHRLVVCEVSCWGFDNSAAAAEFVLSALIDALEDHVDCLTLRGLPASYVKSLSSGTSGVPVLAHLIVSDSDPNSQLQRLNPILDALDARILVVIEDLDRSETASFDLRQIESTLNRLKSRTPRISFLVSAGPDSKLDFAKLADHIEIVPRLNRRLATTAIKTIRRQCQNAYTDIKSIPPDSASVIFDPRLDYEELRRDPLQPSAEDACLNLMSTTRDLKHVLRRTVQIWDRLHGELDFDDLFILTALRHTATQAFDFLVRNVNLMRGTVTFDDAVKRKKLEITRQNWNDLKQAINGNVGWDIESAWSLLVFLFPDLDDNRFSRFYARNSPQCVRHFEPTDYFNRALAEEIPVWEIRDQHLLHDIDQWLEDSDRNRLVEQMDENPDYVGKWRYFADRVPLEKLLPLASSLITIHLNKHGSDWSGNHPALFSVLARVADSPIDGSVGDEWLTREIARILPRSIALSNYLYDRWAVPVKGIGTVPGRSDLRLKLVELTRSVFTRGNVTNLLKALGKDPDTLYQLVFPRDLHLEDLRLRDAVPSPMREAYDWAWFAPVLLAAAETSNVVMNPQLCALLNVGIQAGNYALNENVITQMFGSHQQRLLEIVAEETDISDLDEGLRQVIFQIRDLSRKRLQGTVST